ncbi:hypothetical protein JOC85_002858 [Bacillus mesophilus]|uniref:Uncharacterized protein n=1 Tax=Bacillus mesophilus TaxID=1808955 RepID=A0A6M0Q8D0_9BACI|nr:hypothetical protein [Bacillus mesophilus]MBM7662051.1 hypothetical protein [Bacillus mesophilus]NEY72594.1 hypothetical protein [Bacillus mesophilus]
MVKKVVDTLKNEEKLKIDEEISQMVFTKNFRSATAEEWCIFLPSFKDPRTGGAAAKAIIHYNLYGNRDVFINTTIIFDDPIIHEPGYHSVVYALADEIVNRLVGYADTLLSVHAGENSYDAEYKK